jgi:curved DNA-binding protein CbpA
MGHTTTDPYAVLGVPHNASQEQVRRAYHRLAKRYHPDLHPDAPSEQMRRVNQAWQTLSSPVRKMRDDTQPARTGSRGSEDWAAPRRRAAPRPLSRRLGTRPRDPRSPPVPTANQPPGHSTPTAPTGGQWWPRSRWDC